jgi:hypothetical protein
VSAIGSSLSQYPSYGSQSANDAQIAAREAKADKPGYDLDEITLATSQSANGTASVSLDADLNSTTASTETGALTLAIAKALQTATEVDPATGRRELIAGASDQLTQTVDTLLTNNGFTADEAANATSNLAQELAQGGQISLSSSIGQTGQVSGGSTTSYGSLYSIVSATTDANQATNAISIGIDLDTGALNVSLKSQATSVTQSNTLYQGEGYSEEAYSNSYQIASEQGGHYGTSTTKGAAGSALSETETDTSSSDMEGSRQVVDTLDGSQSVINASFSLVNGNYSSTESTVDFDKSLFATQDAQQLEQAAPTLTGGYDPTTVAVTNNGPAQSKNDATGNDALKRLIANLTDPKVFKEAQAAGLVQQLSTIADNVRAQVKATAEALDKQIAAQKAAATDVPQTSAQQQELKDLVAHAQDAQDLYKRLSVSGDGASVSAQIGVRQTVSISQTDRDGCGTTLYKRPDGTLGKFTTAPTKLTA